MKNRPISIFILLVVAGHATSCHKFLEAKSVQSLATPSSLSDLEAISNNKDISKGTSMLSGMADEYYVTYTDWLSRTEEQKNGYIWDPQLNDYTDWYAQYYAVLNANTILFNLELVPNNGDKTRANTIKGTALYYRSWAFFRIALLFAPQYDAKTVETALGIPLRLTADINEASKRSTLRETYNQITGDLLQALDLLPNNVPDNRVTKTRPSKAAAHGLLARVYLQMGDYPKAKEHATASLQTHSALMDFNDANWVSPAAASPFKELNPEIISYAMTDFPLTANSRAKVDSVLYKSYDTNDLRKTAYFAKNTDVSYRFKGSYSVSLVELFCGIATDELLLIRAECAAREGNASAAMKDVNDLLRSRWKKKNGVSTYVDQTATDAQDALLKVLGERRKELVYRETRWADLKRLNKEPGLATTIVRNMDGQLVTLPPDDLRYSLLIPMEVMRIASLPQNPR
jgi:tetratricopeptide (TPR) repeat protein